MPPANESGGVAAMSSSLDPSLTVFGEYLALDGTIESYGRINCILKPTDIVLDLGAGRRAWLAESEVQHEKTE
jgi:hypothetical protein